MLFDASNQRQSSDVQIGGLHLLQTTTCCRRSLQLSAAWIPFDTAEKKVTGGAWFDISLNDLL